MYAQQHKGNNQGNRESDRETKAQFLILLGQGGEGRVRKALVKGGGEPS